MKRKESLLPTTDKVIRNLAVREPENPDFCHPGAGKSGFCKKHVGCLMIFFCGFVSIFKVNSHLTHQYEMLLVVLSNYHPGARKPGFCKTSCGVSNNIFFVVLSLFLSQILPFTSI